MVDTHNIEKYLNKSYRRFEKRLDICQKLTPVNSRYISTTDPDASVTRRGGKSKLRYKTHRTLDPACEVITATRITPGSIDDGDMLEEMIETHKANTQIDLDVTVADSKYGTIDNFLLLKDKGIKAHIPSLEGTQRSSGRQKGIFPKEDFTYNPKTDTFTCPKGHILKRRNYNGKRNHWEYKAPSRLCAKCELRDKCTRSKNGRTLKRHLRQDELDGILKHTKSTEGKRDIKTRQHLCERSFARSKRYGFKKARWRGLWRMEIQDFLIATLQNIIILANHSTKALSKSNARIGQFIKTKRAVFKESSVRSFVKWLFSKLILPSPWEGEGFDLEFFGNKVSA